MSNNVTLDPDRIAPLRNKPREKRLKLKYGSHPTKPTRTKMIEGPKKPKKVYEDLVCLLLIYFHGT